MALVEDRLDELHRTGVRIVIFEGGEPLLWKDGEASLGHLVRLARRRFIAVGVTTNGTLPFADLDADVVWVSLDGLRETHDALRGPSFDRAIAHMTEASKAGRPAYANVTINRLNAAEIPRLVRQVAPLVRGFTFQFHYPYGRGEEDLVPSPETRRNVLRELGELKREGLPVSLSHACLGALERGDWTCHDFLLANVEPDGSVAQGCYVRNRGKVNCALCGFAAHVEISLAFDLHPQALWAGWRIFRWRF
jgi:MoaA/NifB/PqqE/SkfB family radical SAM enzyme